MPIQKLKPTAKFDQKRISGMKTKVKIPTEFICPPSMLRVYPPNLFEWYVIGLGSLFPIFVPLYPVPIALQNMKDLITNENSVLTGLRWRRFGHTGRVVCVAHQIRLDGLHDHIGKIARLCWGVTNKKVRLCPWILRGGPGWTLPFLLAGVERR